MLHQMLVYEYIYNFSKQAYWSGVDAYFIGRTYVVYNVFVSKNEISTIKAIQSICTRSMFKSKVNDQVCGYVTPEQHSTFFKL